MWSQDTSKMLLKVSECGWTNQHLLPLQKPSKHARPSLQRKISLRSRFSDKGIQGLALSQSTQNLYEGI